MLRKGAYVFTDVLDSVTKSLKLGHLAKQRSQILKQDKHTMVTHRIELVESITADRVRVAIPFQPTGVHPILPESYSAINIQNESMEETLWRFRGIFSHYLKDDGQFEFLLKWNPNHDAIWKPRNNVHEKTDSNDFARMRIILPEQ